MKREVICGIYIIISPTGCIYIGQARDIYKRWSFYKFLHCDKQCRLYNSLKKYGPENHTFEIVCDCSMQDLGYLESSFINFFDTFETLHGLNLTTGGENYKHSEESKQKMKEVAGKHLKGKKQSPEHIERGRQARIGKQRSPETIEKMKQKKLSEEHKRILTIATKVRWDKKKADGDTSFSKEVRSNMSKARQKYWNSLSPEELLKICEFRKGRVRTEEHKANYRLGQKKRLETQGPIVLTEEHKKNISIALKGRKGKKGLVHTEKTKKAMSEASKLMWKRIKEDPEYNSPENKAKRSEKSRQMALKSAANRPKFVILTPDELKAKSNKAKAAWARRRELGLRNRKSTTPRKPMTESTRQMRIDAMRRRISDPEYYSEENKLRRSECQKKAAQTKKDNEAKKIEQEKLTMIF